MAAFDGIVSIKLEECSVLYDPDEAEELCAFFVRAQWVTANGPKCVLTRHLFSDFYRLDKELWWLVPSYVYSYSNPKPRLPNEKPIGVCMCAELDEYINALFKWCATFSNAANKGKVHETFNAFLLNDSSLLAKTCVELSPTERDYMAVRSISMSCGGYGQLPLFSYSKHLVTLFGVDSGALSDWLWKLDLHPRLMTLQGYTFFESLPEAVFSHLTSDYARDNTLTAETVSRGPLENIVWTVLGPDATYGRYSRILSGANEEQRRSFRTVVINEHYLEIVADGGGSCEAPSVLKSIVTLVAHGDTWCSQNRDITVSLIHASEASLLLCDGCAICGTGTTGTSDASSALESIRAFVECQLAAVSCKPAAADGVFFVPESGFFLRKAYFALTRLGSTVKLGSQDTEKKLRAVRRRFNVAINSALLRSVSSEHKQVPSHNLGLLLLWPTETKEESNGCESKDLEYVWEIVRARVASNDLTRDMDEATRDCASALIQSKRYSTWMRWLTGADKQIRQRLERIKASAEERLSL